MKKRQRLSSAIAASLLTSAIIYPSFAQSQSADTIVVFDGSGSMWGQIDGRAKIEIARETLSTVLSEIPSDVRIGMIAYGHRQKGVCSDIETVVPVGPAGRSVPAMIDVANAMQPKGKTPLTDAVRIAADTLKSTENAATVILVTDGIETCDADPCALASELERSGVGFTTHVVGFGLSKDEGRQVQCLADNTGGIFLSANNADELGAALRKTVQAEVIVPSEDDFGPAIVTARNVRFIFRDTPEGEQLGIRQLSGVLERADGGDIPTENFKFAYPEANGNSATAILEPGNYVALLRRGDAYTIAYEFEVPEGDGEYVIEASLAGALTINVFINPSLPYAKGDPFPYATGGSSHRINFKIYPVLDGVKAQEPISDAHIDKLTVPLSPGWYLVQGNIDRTTSAEHLIEVKAGAPTQMDFSFDATRVFVDARDDGGFPVKRQTTYWYDKVPSGRNYWVRGGGNQNGEIVPFYMPTGQWIVNTGNEGGGTKRSQVSVQVPGDFQDIRLKIGESEVVDSDTEGYFSSPAYTGCLEILAVRFNGCLVKKADLSVTLKQNKPDDNIVDVNKDTPVDVPDFLAGLTGVDYVFVDENNDPKLHIIQHDGDNQNATIVLADNWCGFSQCGNERISVDYKRVKTLFEGSAGNSSFGADGYRFELNANGNDAFIRVSGAGASKVRMNMFDTIILSGENSGAAGQTPQPISTTDANGAMFGIFSLHDAGGQSVDEIVGDYFHTQQCQRSQMVMYPDGGIEMKKFMQPTSATDNPFKTQGKGSCEISGDRYNCTIVNGIGGSVDTLSFTAKSLSNNHFEIMEDGRDEPTIAGACFYPGGEVKANQIMPNGRSLADLITERSDASKVGFYYDENNAISLQE